MQACWEYLGCTKEQCIMFGRRDIPCWTLEGTLCRTDDSALCHFSANGCKWEECEKSGCHYFAMAAAGRGTEQGD